jgi:hypothetical protein
VKPNSSSVSALLLARCSASSCSHDGDAAEEDEADRPSDGSYNGSYNGSYSEPFLCVQVMLLKKMKQTGQEAGMLDEQVGTQCPRTSEILLLKYLYYCQVFLRLLK